MFFGNTLIRFSSKKPKLVTALLLATLLPGSLIVNAKNPDGALNPATHKHVHEQIVAPMIPILPMPVPVVDGIHILSELFDSCQPTVSRQKTTVGQGMRHLFMPMLHTSLTSAAGSASLAPIPPVQPFGLSVAFSIILAWLSAIVCMPSDNMLMRGKRLDNFGITAANGERQENFPSRRPRRPGVASSSATDNDCYLHATAHPKISDQWAMEAGANIFLGADDHTFFGQLGDNTNIFAGLRRNF